MDILSRTDLYEHILTSALTFVRNYLHEPNSHGGMGSVGGTYYRSCNSRNAESDVDWSHWGWRGAALGHAQLTKWYKYVC